MTAAEMRNQKEFRETIKSSIAYTKILITITGNSTVIMTT
jgi:hypothetical protein